LQIGVGRVDVVQWQRDQRYCNSGDHIAVHRTRRTRGFLNRIWFSMARRMEEAARSHNETGRLLSTIE
jgi:hypothetical protein